MTAGGGFSGTETTGAVNDFVRETVRYYPPLGEELIRVVVVHPRNFILPELGEELGRYAERKLLERKVEVIKGARVANYDGVVVTLSDGTSIPAATLIWTAGVKPSPVIASLGCKTDRGVSSSMNTSRCREQPVCGRLVIPQRSPIQRQASLIPQLRNMA